MQLPIVSKDPAKAAHWLFMCGHRLHRHKLINECVQCLVAAHKITGGPQDFCCKPTHVGHPIVHWIASKQCNYDWACGFARAMCLEFEALRKRTYAANLQAGLPPSKRGKLGPHAYAAGVEKLASTPLTSLFKMDRVRERHGGIADAEFFLAINQDELKEVGVLHNGNPVPRYSTEYSVNPSALDLVATYRRYMDPVVAQARMERNARRAQAKKSAQKASKRARAVSVQ